MVFGQNFSANIFSVEILCPNFERDYFPPYFHHEFTIRSVRGKVRPVTHFSHQKIICTNNMFIFLVWKLWKIKKKTTTLKSLNKKNKLRVWIFFLGYGSQTDSLNFVHDCTHSGKNTTGCKRIRKSNTTCVYNDHP